MVDKLSIQLNGNHLRRFESEGRWARGLRRLHVVADAIAFLLESACVGNGVFWFLTWGMLSFNWEVTAREYGRFWTHYARATPAARHPVEAFVLATLVVLTLAVAFTRAPRAIRLAGVGRAARTNPGVEPEGGQA